jgi:hypothetical protein
VWSRTDSNRRPVACKATALPTKLRPQIEKLRERLRKATSLPHGGVEVSEGHNRPGGRNGKSVKERRCFDALKSYFVRLSGIEDRSNHNSTVMVDRPCSQRRVDSGESAILSAIVELLLRKEVIQPQVPLRLPCYDFIPITSLAVGRCLPKVSSRTSGETGFHDVTGGVYKPRERIHGAVADAPLLAIPTSWSRVADSNPNWARL